MNPETVMTEQEDYSEVSPKEILSTLSKHLLSLYFPLVALTYLLTVPHVWWASILFIFLPGVVAHYLDASGMEETKLPNPNMPNWPFDLLMFVAAGLQFLNIYLFIGMLTQYTPWSIDAFLGALIVSISAAYSGITLAHEFIHRRNKWYQLIGRALLVNVWYEHFYTEHLRGHHVRVATEQDPATARYGERFMAFYFRTVPGQFISAWKLEAKRLGDEDMPVLDARIIRNRVFQGVAAELLLASVVFSVAGIGGLLLFAFHAIFATRALEAVNYFEHWGLTRSEKHVTPKDSWDTHSWFTFYGLFGLARHADHHAHPSRPYHQLRQFDGTPKLPYGYVVMVPFSIFKNVKFQERMTEELKKNQLGPYLDKGSEALQN